MRQQHQVNSVNLPIGEVRKVGFDVNIPEGWRKMRIDEGRMYKNQLKPLINQWSIVAFQIGAFVGGGYGMKFWEHYGGQCGEGFIIGPRSTKINQSTSVPIKQTETKTNHSNHLQDVGNMRH